MAKKWWRSKTLLANALMAVAIIIQAITGEAWLNTEVQGAIVIVVNVVLRLVTNKGLEK